MKNVIGVFFYRFYFGWKYILGIFSIVLIIIVISIRVVFECVLVLIWNIGVLLVDLLWVIIRLVFCGIEFVGKVVYICLVFCY